MTIDGTNISTLGLHLSYFDGHLNLPARKNILTEPGFAEKDLVFDALEPVIDLIGYYTTKTAMATAIMTFTSLIMGQTIHAFNMGGHSVSFNGVLADGVKVETIRTMLRINFKIIKVE